MTERLNILLALSVITIFGGTAGVCLQLAKRPAVPRPSLGARGVKRARALRQSAVFALTEPPLRALAAWIAILPIAVVRAPCRRSLTHAGNYLGLSADELLAGCVLSGAAVGLGTWLVCSRTSLPWELTIVALGIGAVAPWLRVLSVAQNRARSVSRALPGAVDLAAMCMSAGLDFPGAFRRIVESASNPDEPVIEEFARVLQELDLGQTRRSAMEGLATRVPTEQVREFVNSVVQAEDKGSPLASVLIVQAQSQRLRRSIAAEETASEAALMLLGPMTLIFLCVIVLLLGPVVVRFMTGGLGPS